MKTLKEYVKEWVKAPEVVTLTDTAVQDSTLDNLSEVEETENNSADKNFAPEDDADDLEVYETTAKEIKWWHAFGSFCPLQDILQEYDLGFGSRDRAYSRFKIGYNVEEHFASFAIDETHYYKIQFTKYDGEPIDRQAAKKVLEKINQLRSAK